MLLDMLRASSLRNLLSRSWARTASGRRTQGIIRTGEGATGAEQDFGCHLILWVI